MTWKQFGIVLFEKDNIRRKH